MIVHIASIEKVHQLISFENRDFNKLERLKWEATIELGEKARGEIKKMSLEYYLSVLSQVREETITRLKSKMINGYMRKENGQMVLPIIIIIFGFMLWKMKLTTVDKSGRLNG